MTKPKKYYAIRGKRGISGILTSKPLYEKQDRRAKSGTFYAVVFFPKIKQLKPAGIHHHEIEGTLSQSKGAAIAKFMDRIHQREKWKSYYEAGHRVRKVKIVDLGDA